MNRITSILFIAFFIFSCNDETKIESDNTEKSDSSNAMSTSTDASTDVPLDSATKMKNWMAYMTPGEPHKMLEKSNGTWNGEITMWETPDAPPMKSTGTAVNSMMYGGRYQVSKMKGTMMGQPFEGTSTIGFDNHKKVFVNTWVDNMGTGVMYMEGPWDETSKTMTLKGKAIDPTTGKECDFRETFKIIDDKTQLMEMYSQPAGGKEFKTMEIKFTRKG